MNLEEAIKEYTEKYSIITDLHINEIIKLEYLIPKIKDMLPHGEYEVKIEDNDFKGFIDLLAHTEDENTYDLYDFKYSNNVQNYLNSKQLHLYKYFFEKINKGKKIRDLYFLFIPKISIRQKKTEDIFQFRQRLRQELDKCELQLVKVDYDYTKVIDFTLNIKKLLETNEFNKFESKLCKFCEYKDFCEKGTDYMILPKNERRNIEKIDRKVIWIYGSPFSGKTTFANNFPNPLMINTDGNIKFIDSPYIPIKDQVKAEGRIVKRTLAWDIFKDTITELEKNENDFNTIIVDLVEDLYEHCRLYIYDEMGITHESDDSFRAWDKVRTEFLSTMRRLMNLDYNNIILISHEDTSKDITKKGGDKITAIKPNIPEKVANKLAGMVDMVARVIADDESRILSFKTNEVIFGGGRLRVSNSQINLDYDSFIDIFQTKEINEQKEGNENKETEANKEVKKTRKRRSVV